MSRFAVASLLLVAVLRNLVASESAGITNIVATGDKIIISGDTGKDAAGIFEIPPSESFVLPLKRPALETTRGGRFAIGLPRWNASQDRAYSSFIAVAAGSHHAFGTNRFVEDFHGLWRDEEPFPASTSKKGLQVQMIDDALALGVKHAALNVNLTSLVGSTNGSDSIGWTNRGGTTFSFHRGRVESLDRQVKRLSGAGVVISLIILAYESSRPELTRLMLHPLYEPKAPNHLGAFNTETEEGVTQLAASMEFLVERYSRADRRFGRAVNFIIGNEINSHWFWYNMGPATMTQVAAAYSRAVRICHTAVRQYSAHARVYLSLEHHWNIRYPGGNERQSFAGRPFLEYFGQSAKAQGDFDWNLAFHPYPENLFECRTWQDKSATLRDDTPRITFKNLEMLVSFLGRGEMLYHGIPRRIILSEQGFHSRNSPEGEKLQAAAYAYAYFRTLNLPGIDAFILHRQVDHPAEGGLNLGLWRRDQNGKATTRKPIYEVFHHADLPDWAEYLNFALPVIGIKSWDELKPAGAGKQN